MVGVFGVFWVIFSVMTFVLEISPAPVNVIWLKRPFIWAMGLWLCSLMSKAGSAGHYCIPQVYSFRHNSHSTVIATSSPQLQLTGHSAVISSDQWYFL